MVMSFLPLALGFPLETSIAMARAFLAGVFDMGGMAGSIESCMQLRMNVGLNCQWGEICKDVWDAPYLENEPVYLAAVVQD